MGNIQIKKVVTSEGDTTTTYGAINATLGSADIIFDSRICIKSADSSTWEIKMGNDGVITTNKL